jgi:hypothetical protein
MAFDGTIMALDISSVAMGICEGRPGETPRFSTIRLKREDDSAADAFSNALRWAAQRFSNFAPDRLVVERRLPTMNAFREDDEGNLKPTTNPRTVHLLCGLSAIIVGAARNRGIRHVPGPNRSDDDYGVPVSTARKAFLGKGNYPSDEAKRLAFKVCQTLGWEPNTYDEADAACVWTWACQQLAPDKAPGTHPLQLQALQARLGGRRAPAAQGYEVEP